MFRKFINLFLVFKKFVTGGLVTRVYGDFFDGILGISPNFYESVNFL